MGGKVSSSSQPPLNLSGGAIPRVNIKIKLNIMANGAKPRTMKAIAGVIELEGQIVSTAKSGKNLVLSNVPGYPQPLIVPSGLGLKEGEELIGDGSVTEVTYYEKDGADLATPIVRFELTGYKSLAAQAKAQELRAEMAKNKAHNALETAVINSKVAAVAGMVWESKDFNFAKAVGAA